MDFVNRLTDLSNFLTDETMATIAIVGVIAIVAAALIAWVLRAIVSAIFRRW